MNIFNHKNYDLNYIKDSIFNRNMTKFDGWDICYIEYMFGFAIISQDINGCRHNYCIDLSSDFIIPCKYEIMRINYADFLAETPFKYFIRNKYFVHTLADLTLFGDFILKNSDVLSPSLTKILDHNIVVINFDSNLYKSVI